MAITIPSDLELTPAYQLHGYVPSSQYPLHTLARRTNWLYAKYAPALFQGALYAEEEESITYLLPVTASADSMAYKPLLVLLTATTDDVEVTIETSPDGSAWSSVTGWTARALACTSGIPNEFYSEADFTIPAGTILLRLTVTHATSAGSDWVQCPTFLCYPRLLSSISSGAKASGFVPYEDAVMATAGAPIHAELLNRIAANVYSVVQDRWCSLGGFIQPTSHPLRMSASGSYVSRTLYRARWHLPGNTSSTVRVRAKFGDSGSGKLRIEQIQGGGEGSYVELDDSTAHQTATFTAYGEHPVINVQTFVGTTMDVDYVCFEWRPNIGSADPLITELAPPAKLAYLNALEDVTMRAALHALPFPGYFFDPSQCLTTSYGGVFSGDGVQYALVRTAAGAIGARLAFARASAGGSDAMADTLTVSKDVVTAANQDLTIPSPLSGTPVWPPKVNAWVNPTELYETAAELSDVDDDGNYAASLTEDREPRIQFLAMNGCHGVGGRWMFIDSPSSLP